VGEQAKAEGIYQLILELDSEGNGNISFEQFIHLMTPKLLKNDSRENVDRIFTLFDS
jgi:Ca2+-binding EF-hand superfamily protein